MAADYDKLSAEYENSASVLIADVDCTVHQDLCQQHDVQGYPTLKYWVDGNKEANLYKGGRDYDSLKKFIAENLEAKCLVDQPDDCSEKEKSFIEKMRAKNSDEVATELTRLQGMSVGSMKPQLRSWLMMRIAILKQLQQN